jgi:hypothetical protein
MRSLSTLKTLALALIVLAWLVACTVPAGTQEPTQRLPTDAEVEQYNASVAPDERIICREEIPVGTYISKRVCRLVKDIQETSELHRDQLGRALH